MNDVNFINAASRDQQKSIRRWIITTTILCGCVALAMSCLQSYQWYTIRKCKKEQAILIGATKDFEAIMNKKQELIQQKELLHKQSNTLARRKNSPKLPLDLLVALKSLTGTTIQLQSLNIEKGKLKIDALASLSGQATQFSTQLGQKAHVKDAKLVALKNHTDDGKKWLLFTVEGNMSS